MSLKQENLERLMTRLVDGEAAPGDWSDFQRLAADDPSLWRSLGEAQADHAALAAELKPALDVADRVELPTGHATFVETHELRTHRLPPAASWLGWAAAAVLLAAWSLGWGRYVGLPADQPATVHAPVETASLLNFRSAGEAYEAYLEQGRESGLVVGEWPVRLLLDTRPLEQEGGYEVYYLRQILERREVPRMYEISGVDELGRPIPAPVEHTNSHSL